MKGRRTPAKKTQPASMAEAMILDSEAAVMANFEFLGQTDVEMSDDDDVSDDLDLVNEGEETDTKTSKRKTKAIIMNEGKDFIYLLFKKKNLFKFMREENKAHQFLVDDSGSCLFLYCTAKAGLTLNRNKKASLCLRLNSEI